MIKFHPIVHGWDELAHVDAGLVKTERRVTCFDVVQDVSEASARARVDQQECKSDQLQQQNR